MDKETRLMMMVYMTMEPQERQALRLKLIEFESMDSKEKAEYRSRVKDIHERFSGNNEYMTGPRPGTCSKCGK